MAFDTDKTVKDMASAVSGVLAGEWPAIKGCVEAALQDEKDAIADIAKARIKKEINDDEMKSHLEDEKLALEAALLACQVKAKVAVQSAANAAINVLKNAIRAAL